MTANVVVVLGPTASGKSDVAMSAALAAGNTHIVACDSMQVYRRMDIGTAKPTVADRTAVTHHGLDLCEPGERYTVSRFVDDVTAARGSIRAVGARELIVGGTGLYLTAITDGLTMPGEWPEVRAELEADPDTASLFARLSELDPVAVTRMEPNNRRRIIRALEVCIGSGEPFSSYGEGVSTFPDNGVTYIGIRWQRDALRERIARRVHMMVGAGLVDEVRGLLAEPGGLSPTAVQALGYKEMIDHLEGRIPLADAVADVILRTQQFAVRQERWYRRDPRIRWVDVDRDPAGEVTPFVLAALS
ncbi:MAG: tRNA delta(2)-isopentenylpyrophosphate transferase [Actinomycetota bacterium]|jgi:tRNA dimethylallyltransferase